MRPELLAFDLDETLLNEHSDLSGANREILQRAAAVGIELVIASGRAYATLPDVMRQFPGIRYAICGNGSSVYDMDTGNPILRYTIRPEALKRVLELTEGEDIAFEVFIDGTAYGQRDYIAHPERFMTDGKTVDYVKRTRKPVEDIRGLMDARPDELDSLALVVSSMEQKAELIKKLKSVPDIYVTVSTPRLIEISDARCGKHRALQWLADYLHIPQEKTAAFGNANNDAEMLSWAGIGVAVANSTPECLRSADYITKHYLEDGVAAAFDPETGILTL